MATPGEHPVDCLETTPYPYDERMDREEYETTLYALQVELLKLQRFTKKEGHRLIVIFEGRDAAGKGGTIKRFREHLNPRGARLVALPKPSDVERGQWYLQRYIAHLPTRGEMVFFDRSWYNRAGVEPVMGFCTPTEYRDFFRIVPGFERAIVEDGFHLFKLWFSVSREQQKKRFDDRRDDPLKQWKLSPMDIESMKRFDEYTVARDRMFFATHTRDAPWTVIRSDDKRRARLAALRTVLSAIDYEDKDPDVIGPRDPKIVFPPPPPPAGFDEITFTFKNPG